MGKLMEIGDLGNTLAQVSLNTHFNLIIGTGQYFTKSYFDYKSFVFIERLVSIFMGTFSDLI